MTGIPILEILIKQSTRKQMLIGGQGADVAELADALDSGSSAHYGRAGSSPASRTMIDP